MVAEVPVEERVSDQLQVAAVLSVEEGTVMVNGGGCKLPVTKSSMLLPIIVGNICDFHRI